MSFSPKVKTEVLVACGRSCSLCHRFCGMKLELHHIKQRSEGGADTIDNCIALCFECHADMRSYDHKHPKGTKYTEAELRAHRDSWVSKVEGSGGVTIPPEHLDLDRASYRRLTGILTWSGSIAFIRDNNFAGFFFERKRLDELYQFLQEAEDPSFDFIDSDLEGLRSQLLISIQKLLSSVGTNTFYTDSEGYSTVPPDWEHTNPKVFREAIAELHGAAGEICDSYDALVKLGKRKLGI